MDVWLCFFAGLYRPLRSSKYQLSLHIVSEISTDLHQVLVTRSLFFCRFEALHRARNPKGSLGALNVFSRVTDTFTRFIV